MRRLLVSVLLLSIMSCVALGSMFLRDLSRTFPEISEGSYAGMVIPSAKEGRRPLYVVKTASSRDVVVVLGDSDFPAQRVPVLDPSGSNRLALVIAGNQARLKLTGVKKTEGRLEGDWVDPIRDIKGEWFLERVGFETTFSQQGVDLQGWLISSRELRQVEGEIKGLEKRYDSNRIQMDRLNRYLIDDGALKDKASSRLTGATGSLVEAQSELGKIRADLEEKAKSAELSQRVSPRGRLAVLSRESLQRESRWIEITLRLLAPEMAPDFEAQLERATRVKELEDHIAAERARIEEIESVDRYRGANPETPKEEEFYRELQ